MKCRQPGCSGTIVDGYCDICGMAATSIPKTSAPSFNNAAQASQPKTSEPVGKQATTTRPARLETVKPSSTNVKTKVAEAPKLEVRQGSCPQAGCSGTIVDGYCNLCGQPPIVKALPSVLGTKIIGIDANDGLAMVNFGSKRPEAKEGKKPRAAFGAARSKIGAGITQVPAAPQIDPVTCVLTNPVVPVNRRICSNCAKPVGRPSQNQPEGLTFGVCQNCQTAFDFRPPIKSGELVAAQYEVAGCLAYGGLGWVYLAKDRNVSDRWVVLKGLLNVNDADAAAATKSEGQFLAQVEHPQIVEIYNYVRHNQARYIVMEYVPGRSLTDLLKQRRQENDGLLDPLPLDWALAYIVEILPALSYLHSAGLLYCDFKPDNVMQVGDSLKLIDLGAMRRIDDENSAIFGTLGYQAPEVAEQGCSVASDIYTVGRTLMVLGSQFRGYQSQYANCLPPAYKLPQFDSHDSLYRLVQKACAPDPQDRFQSAEELRVQALGVLREIVGRASGGSALTSQLSSIFTGPNMVDEDSPDWRSLPQLRSDVNDPMREWLTALKIDDLTKRFDALEKAPMRTPSVILAQTELALQMGDTRQVDALVSQMLREDPWDWRALWISGLAQVQEGNWDNAAQFFNTVYAQLPGELAPKFALAVVCEQARRLHLAEELYAICASTDAAYVTPCAFGLARIRQQHNDRKGTLDALALVPTSSLGYRTAREQRARIFLERGNTIEDFAAALDSARVANLDAPTAASFEVDILERALALVLKQGNQSALIDGQPATKGNIRMKLEHAYQVQASWAQDDKQRTRLLAKADNTRKWSLW